MDRKYNFKTVELRAGDSSFELPDGFQFIGFTPNEPLQAVFVERVNTPEEQEVIDLNKAMTDLLAPKQLKEAQAQLESMKQALDEAAFAEEVDAEVIAEEHPVEDVDAAVEAVESAVPDDAS